MTTRARTTRTRRTATAPAAPADEQYTGKVIIVVGGREIIHTHEQVGVTMDTADDEILRACQSIVTETSLTDPHGVFAYSVRKTTDRNNIHVYPKTPAGR